MLLSTLVEKLNERSGTDFGPADQLFFDQVRETAIASEHLRQAAEANSLENFIPVFEGQLETLLLERMDGNEEIFQRVMNDDSFHDAVAQFLVRTVYEDIRKTEIA